MAKKTTNADRMKQADRVKKNYPTRKETGKKATPSVKVTPYKTNPLKGNYGFQIKWKW